MKYLMKENVLGLDIPVDDIAVMHEFHRVTGLFYDTSGPLLRKTALTA